MYITLTAYTLKNNINISFTDFVKPSGYIPHREDYVAPQHKNGDVTSTAATNHHGNETTFGKKKRGTLSTLK